MPSGWYARVTTEWSKALSADATIARAASSLGLRRALKTSIRLPIWPEARHTMRRHVPIATQKRSSGFREPENRLPASNLALVKPVV